MPIVDDGNRAPMHSRVERRRNRNADLHYVRGQRSRANAGMYRNVEARYVRGRHAHTLDKSARPTSLSTTPCRRLRLRRKMPFTGISMRV